MFAVKKLFRKLLRRQGNTAEVDAIEALSLSRSDTVREFVLNNQSSTRTMDEEYAAWVIRDLHRQVFGRDIAQVQLEKLVSDRMADTLNQRTILEHFLNSEAFFALAVENGYQVRRDASLPPDIIMDSEDATGVTFIGPWSSSTTVSGYLGSNYMHDQNSLSGGSKRVVFTPPLIADGNYTIYLYWTSNSQRASQVPVDIKLADGSTTTHGVNQRENHATWVDIGTYNLSAANATVTIRRTSTTNGYVIADGVKFVWAE